MRLQEESEFVTKNLLAELGSQDDDPSKLDELRVVDHFITPFFELVLKKSISMLQPLIDCMRVTCR